MSTDPDKETACPEADKVVVITDLDEGHSGHDLSEKKRKKPSRSVRFPDEDQLVTQYFEPANPWHDVPSTTRAQLAAEYLEACRRHNTPPIDSVLQQIRELPENSIGGWSRAARLVLSECSLAGAAPADALETLLRRVQFARIEVNYCEIDDEGAEAMFDMIEYYESANVVSISGPRQFGIRGWQAACRMIKKSAELSELDLCESALCASHAPVLVRALRPHTCRLRSLCLQRAELRGEPLLCLVIALKSNTSIRELRLPDNQLTVSDAQQLASLLRLNLHIQLLDLSNNDIQDAGTGYLADALVEQAAQTPPSAATSPLSPLHCPPGGREARLGLAFLVLWNNQLTRNCAPHLSKALRSSHSLCVLNIGRNALGADTVRALQCGAALVSLGLQGARLGAGAAQPLADLLRPATTLQRLDLRDNRLGVVGLQAILNAMQENTTVTQIDLDDPVESSTLSSDSEAASVARLTRDIAALCRRNEPPASEPERRHVHRKISLTCHTAFAVKQPPGRCADGARSRTVRLRSPAPSPAPSPAGSPVPHAPHSSRFNVTRVTPDRESSTESSSSPVPGRPPYCLTPSRFKVVQVAEPPQIQIHPATQKRPSSRFSVTRNYDAMYNPSPPSVSPTPSIGSPGVSPSPSVSPVPSSPSITGSISPVMGSALPSPTVIATSVTASPTVIATLVTASPTVISTSMTASPTVIATSVTASPTVISACVTASPTVMYGSPSVTIASVISGSPSVMTGSATTSPIVISDSIAVTASPMRGGLPVISGSPSVLPAVVASAYSALVTASSAVMTASPTVITSSSELPSASPTVIAGLPSVIDITGSPTAITSSYKVMTASSSMTRESETIASVCNRPTINRKSMTIGSMLIGESPRTASGSQTIVDMTNSPIADMTIVPPRLTNVSTMTTPEVCTTSTEPILAHSSPISTSGPANINLSSISPSEFVTSVVKASLSPTLTAVPIISQAITNFPHGPITDENSGNTEIVTENFVTSQEEHNKIIDRIDIEFAKNLMPAGESANPYLKSGTAVEDVNKIKAKSSEISTLGRGTSIDTLTGTIVSETSLNTLSGDISQPLIDEGYRNIESIESLAKVTDIEPSITNIGAKSNVDRYQNEFEARPIHKNLLTPKVVPNAKFSISPIPDSFGITDEHCDKVSEIKPVAIGSQSNVAATDNIEADIVTKLAEITEKVEPKVVLPKALPESIDINKNKTKDAEIESIASGNRSIASRENIPITVIANVSSNTNVDKSITEILQQMVCNEDVSKYTEDSNIMLTKRIEIYEDENLLGKMLIDDTKHETVGCIKSNKEKESDKVALKSILKDEHRYTQSELPKSKDALDVVVKFDQTAKLDVTPHKTISDSVEVSETKTSENMKNKSYSDAVKSDPKYIDKSEQLTHKEEISDSVVKTETKLVKNSVAVCDSDKLDVQIEVTVKKESVQDAKVHSDQNKDFVNIDDIIVKKEPRTMKQIEEITEDLGNLIQEIKDLSSKSRKAKSDCTVDLASIKTNTVPGNFNRDVVLKKNKSESSLDSPDLEVSRLMNKKMVGSPFCDSSSSLEVSGSSMESLNATESQYPTCHLIPKQVVIQESVESDTELDRRKDIALSMGSSIESASEVTPVNSGNYLNMSVSSNESVSPIIFGKKKKIHDSLSSLEASMSSLDSGKQEKVMLTSADSGIEYSLQQPSENKEDNSSNEGTLTHNSSLKETVKKTEQETLTSSPKRTSSLLDVPALKSKSLDKMRKISWVAPSSSFHIPRVDTEKTDKPSHLEKLLSLFQHPTSLFSRSQSEEEKKSASNTPPRKDSTLSSSFWSWGSTIEKEDKEDSSEATDSTLSERVQVSFVDESFSKKLDSKTPSTDTDNTLSEYQSFSTQTSAEKVTDTTDEDLVQKCLGLSITDKAGSNGNSQRASDTTDLTKPNDLNRNYDVSKIDEEKSENKVVIEKENRDEVKIETIRPRSFAAVLKSSGSENSLDKQPSPESGQSVDKLPSKIIRGIKENISPENTLTSSMTNTKTLALELTERQIKNQPVVISVWEVPMLDKSETKTDEIKTHSDLAPIATIEETCDEAADNMVNVKLEFIDDVKSDEQDVIDIDNLDKEEAILDKDRRIDLSTGEVILEKVMTVTRELENVDLGKDALSYLIYENQDFDADTEHAVSTQVEGSLAQELKEAEIKEMLDLSPELVIDEAIEPEVFAKDLKGMKSSPVIPERAKLKKSNSLEDLSQREELAKTTPKTKTIAFKVPETQPRDIPRPKLRSMSGSSPKSLPESLNKPCPLSKLDSALKKRKKVSSLGKMAKDSLLALNMSEEEIAEYRRSYVTSAESLRSLESVSEDANSQSGTSVDSRCRACLRTSQESLMSLDSITEDCKCGSESEHGRSVR